jgi:hypothetical protein
MKKLAFLLLSSLVVQPSLAQSFGAAFESGTQSGSGGSFSLDDLASRAASATQPTRKHASIQTAGKSCSNGFLGMVTYPAAVAYRLPDPPPGQAHGVIVRYVSQVGDNEYYWYQLQVKMAPQSQDRGKYGAVAIVASDDQGYSVIKPDGTPSYVRIYHRRTNTWSELATPAYHEPLRPIYSFTYDFGESLPSKPGIIHVGYGVVSEEARQQTELRSNVTKTILPRILANLKREQERAKERPDEAARALAVACRTRNNPGASSGMTALTGDENKLFSANQEGLQSLCAKATGPMAAVCQLSDAQQRRANALASSKAGAIAADREKASGSSAGKRVEDPEMDEICARGDFDGWIARRARDAELQAKDTEEIARAGVWDFRSAIDDAAERGLCWKVIEWQGSGSYEGS